MGHSLFPNNSKSVQMPHLQNLLLRNLVRVLQEKVAYLDMNRKIMFIRNLCYAKVVIVMIRRR